MTGEVALKLFYDLFGIAIVNCAEVVLALECEYITDHSLSESFGYLVRNKWLSLLL